MPPGSATSFRSSLASLDQRCGCLLSILAAESGIDKEPGEGALIGDPFWAEHSYNTLITNGNLLNEFSVHTLESMMVGVLPTRILATMPIQIVFNGTSI